MQAVVDLLLYAGAAVLGAFLVYRGARGLGQGLRLRRQPWFIGIRDSELSGSAPDSVWQHVGKRWPTPERHPEELSSELRVASYEALARRRSGHIARASELLLIIAASLLGWLLPLGVIGYARTEIALAGTEGVLAFLPAEPGWPAIVNFGPSLAVILAAFGIVSWRKYGLVLEDLSEWYGAYHSAPSPASSVLGFEGIDLLPQHVKPAGALLLLRQPSDVSTVEVLDAQVEVEVKRGLAAVVVRGLDACDAPIALEAAPEYANRALDIIGMRGKRSLALDDVTLTSVIWWHDGTEQFVRLLGTSQMMFTASATVEVRDANGDLVPPPPSPSPTWHESMRYFRMSQTTDDLFDAFRNIYLALESVLSHSAPVRLNAHGRPAEREGDWLKRALTLAAQGIDLRVFLKNPGSAATDGVDEVYQELYVDVRTAIFHAKNGRPVLLPQDLGQRQLVVDAKVRFARLYLALAEQAFNTRFSSGGLSEYAAREMGKAAAKLTRVALTSDTTAISSHEVALSPMGRPVHAFRAAHAPDLDEPFVTFHKGSTSSTTLTLLNSVSRFGLVHEETGELLVVERLPGSLGLADFDRIEVVIGMRVGSGDAPKARYAT